MRSGFTGSFRSRVSCKAYKDEHWHRHAGDPAVRISFRGWIDDVIRTDDYWQVDIRAAKKSLVSVGMVVDQQAECLQAGLTEDLLVEGTEANVFIVAAIVLKADEWQGVA